MGRISAPIAILFMFAALRFSLLCLGVQEDGQAGLQELGGNATLLFYQTPEGKRGAMPTFRKGRQTSQSSPRYP